MSACNSLLRNTTFCVEHRNKSYLLSANGVHKLPNPEYSPSKISEKNMFITATVSVCHAI